MFFSELRRDVKEIKLHVSKLDRQMGDVHGVLYKNDNGIQGRLIKAEAKADNALKTVLSRTTAMWMVFTFALLSIGSVIGYQMYRIDCIAKQFTDVFGKVTSFIPF